MTTMNLAIPQEAATGASRAERADVATLVVDDQAPFREVMKQLLAVTPGFRFAGEVSSGEEAVEAVDSLSPQLVLMDVRMPGIGGIEAARTLATLHPEVVVVLLSVHGPEELSPELVESSGAAAFARKQQLRPKLLTELWERHGCR
ncbi:MAG TPA: response regulator transcription factor [Thermoleophilaceae bacterium]